jgi:hypothetical protein
MGVMVLERLDCVPTNLRAALYLECDMLAGTPLLTLDSTQIVRGDEKMRRNFLIAATCAVFLGRSLLLFSASSTPEYSIEAIRYATSPDVPVSDLVIGAPKDLNSGSNLLTTRHLCL